LGFLGVLGGVLGDILGGVLGPFFGVHVPLLANVSNKISFVSFKISFCFFKSSFCFFNLSNSSCLFRCWSRSISSSALKAASLLARSMPALIDAQSLSRPDGSTQ